MSKGNIISEHSTCLGNNIYIGIHRAMFFKIYFKKYKSYKRPCEEKNMGGW